MITDALISYLKANISLAKVFVSRAPLDSAPCIVIDDNGDSGDRFWAGGGVATGLKDHEFELTVWADLTDGGSRYAARIADEIIQLIDNYAGPMTDATSSPAVRHRIAGVVAINGGGGFDAGPKNYGHSVFLTITYE